MISSEVAWQQNDGTSFCYCFLHHRIKLLFRAELYSLVGLFYTHVISLVFNRQLFHSIGKGVLRRNSAVSKWVTFFFFFICSFQYLQNILHRQCASSYHTVVDKSAAKLSHLYNVRLKGAGLKVSGLTGWVNCWHMEGHMLKLLKYKVGEMFLMSNTAAKCSVYFLFLDIITERNNLFIIGCILRKSIAIKYKKLCNKSYLHVQVFTENV